MADLSKASLGEALAEDWVSPGLADDWSSPSTDSVQSVLAAARFTERLLPAECRNFFHASDKCPTCHGTGQLWDEGLVEVVATLLYDTCFLDGGTLAFYQDRARAVLSALTQEVGK